MLAIEQLNLAMPLWATMHRVQDAALSFEASPQRADGSVTRGYFLEVTAKEKRVSVREAPAILLPKSCPQRHINSDGSFCLALGGSRIETEQDARIWWDRLNLYLNCQEVAHSIRLWPPYAQMSHGTAGNTELLAEHLAIALGRLDDYRSAVRFRTGPISESLRLFDPKRKMLRNGRANCVCGRTGKKGERLLRRKCSSNSNGCLVALENLRLKQETDFWAERKDDLCCGTMDDCPLRVKKSVPEKMKSAVHEVRPNLRARS